MGAFGDIMMPFKGPGGYHNLRSLALTGDDSIGYGQYAISSNPYVFTPPFTVSAWIYVTPKPPTIIGGAASSPRYTIVANRYGGWSEARFIFIYDSASNSLSARLWHNVQWPQVITTIQSANNSVNILNTGWHYVGFSWDGTTNANGVKIFFDNTILAQGAAAGTTLDATPSLSLAIGAIHHISSWTTGYSTDNFKGNIDQVKIWDIAFNSADFIQDKSIMDVTLNPNYSNLINYYDFENSQITGTTVIDQVGSVDLTLINGAVNSPLVP
tara:strand:- start:3175 stop:3984 length:810 start_codon:yes stop_codon:yes gene_type:complete